MEDVSELLGCSLEVLSCALNQRTVAVRGDMVKTDLSVGDVSIVWTFSRHCNATNLRYVLYIYIYIYIYIYMYLSIYPSIYLCIYIYIYIYIYIHTYIYISIYPPVCLCPPVCLSILVPIYLSMHLYIFSFYQANNMFIYLSINLSLLRFFSTAGNVRKNSIV